MNAKLTQANERNECYKEIASLILSTPWLSFDGFSGYVDTFRELMPDEKKFDEFEESIYLTEIDTEIVICIIKTVESNLTFIRKGLVYTKFKQGESNGQTS